MTDNLKLACAFKLNRFQTDMSECIGYSTAQRKWVITKPTAPTGQVTWEVADRITVSHFAPPPHEWYRPTPQGWEQVDVCKLIALLAMYDPSRPVATSAMYNAFWDKLRRSTGVSALCSYTVGSTTMYLTEATNEWIQFSDGQWVLPDQLPAPDTSNWDLIVDFDWEPADVFTVIEDLANRATALPH